MVCMCGFCAIPGMENLCIFASSLDDFEGRKMNIINNVRSAASLSSANTQCISHIHTIQTNECDIGIYSCHPSFLYIFSI